MGGTRSASRGCATTAPMAPSGSGAPRAAPVVVAQQRDARRDRRARQHRRLCGSARAGPTAWTWTRRPAGCTSRSRTTCWARPRRGRAARSSWVAPTTAAGPGRGRRSRRCRSWTDAASRPTSPRSWWGRGSSSWACTAWWTCRSGPTRAGVWRRSATCGRSRPMAASRSAGRGPSRGRAGTWRRSRAPPTAPACATGPR